MRMNGILFDGTAIQIATNEEEKIIMTYTENGNSESSKELKDANDWYLTKWS